MTVEQTKVVDISGVDRTPELRCDVSMLKRLWRRIVERHRRNIAALEQIEMSWRKRKHISHSYHHSLKSHTKLRQLSSSRFRVFRRIRGLGLLQRTGDSILPLRNRTL